MNNNERQFEEMIKKMTFDDKPDYRHRDKLHQELLAAYAGRQWQQERQSLQMGIWRAIMQSRITKLAAVAALVAVVVVGSWLFTKPGPNRQISSLELLAKAQAAEKALFAGDRIAHIINEITIYRSPYNPKTSEMIKNLEENQSRANQLLAGKLASDVLDAGQRRAPDYRNPSEQRREPALRLRSGQALYNLRQRLV
jgi:hypothetical protein